jgi:hypothetical protein
MSKRELRLFIFLGLAVAAMILLSAGLSQLEFSPERPLPRFSLAPPVQAMDNSRLSGGDSLLMIFRAIMALSLALLPVLIVYLLVSPTARKRVLQQVIVYGTFVLAFYLLARRIQPSARDQGIDLAGGVPGLPEGDAPPFPEFTAAPPPWLGLVLSLVIALIIAGVVVGLVLFVVRRRRPPETALQELARSAQDALDALHGGADVKNTVIRCYLEMSQVVRERRGLQRHADMTPHEFQAELEKAGLPDEPVRQLTRLFEDVRYGDRPASEREGQQAVACLRAIAAAAKS